MKEIIFDWGKVIFYWSENGFSGFLQRNPHYKRG